MNVSSDVYSMRIYCCQHKKQMGETTAEPRAKTFKCSHCIRVCGSMIGLYSQSRGAAATRLTHCGRTTHCLSRQKEANNNNNNNIHNKHQWFIQPPVVFLAYLQSQYCGGFRYCNGRPPTNSIHTFSIYNVLEAISM